MNLKKDDWYGLGGSLLLHLLLLLAFGVMNLGVSEPEPIGFIEVELGPFAQGRPVQRAVEEQPEATEQPEPEPEREERPKPTPPKEARPVEAPKQLAEVRNEEQIKTPETKTVSPVVESSPPEVEEPEPEPDPRPARPRPLGAGAEDGTSGATQGDQGNAEDERKTAPYLIEGLDDRSLVARYLPDYVEKVNTTIKMRIVVNPQGQVLSVVPVQKGGSPALERAVQDALKRWRFNTLPSSAPRYNQTGVITFIFRLE